MKLSEKQKETLNALAKKYDLKLIILFGSFASGKARENSDMDISVLFNRGKRNDLEMDAILDIIAELTKVFQKEIDLSIANYANPLLLKQIYLNCQLLFGDTRAFNEFRLRAFHSFNGYAPYFAREARLVKDIIKKM